ncbi:MAG: hypothetical protein EBU90_09185 [Proteobacteria bacterium]|nr:hypothetical protein [Pseudomonadota bacterium]NBP14273.1 hypothetical protein [bacterium]
MPICSRCKHQFDASNYKTCNDCRDYNKKIRSQIPRLYRQGEFSSVDGKTKQCSDCLLVKSLSQFYKHHRYKDGYRNQCVQCHSVRWSKYYVDSYHEVLKEKYRSDDLYRLKQNHRSYLHQQLKGRNLTKRERTEIMIGCCSQTMKEWLEFQFEKGMTWENKQWQVDHVVPVSLFDLRDDKQRVLAFHWTNVQPLFTKDNQTKYNKFNPIQYCNSIINACRFIAKKRLSTEEYKIISERLQWIQKNISLRHFQIVGKP